MQHPWTSATSPSPQMQEIPWKTGSCSHQSGVQQAPAASSWDPVSLAPEVTSVPCWAPQFRRGIPILEPVQKRPQGGLGHPGTAHEERLWKGQRGFNWIFIKKKPNSWNTTGNGQHLGSAEPLALEQLSGTGNSYPKEQDRGQRGGGMSAMGKIP